MKKKRLNRQQLSRIEKLQQKFARRAESGGQDTQADDTRDNLGPETKGLVISHFGQQIDIEALEGEHKGEIFRCHQRTNLEPLVAGDLVIWRPGDPIGIVVANLPRTTVLKRPAGMGELRPVAANIDNVVVVIAPEPEPFENLIDRYLIAARSSNLKAAIVLNKMDLIEAHKQAALADLLSVYERIGYPALRVSAKSLGGLNALKDLLKDKTSIFVGQSGVGKSALINALLPDVNTLEGSLSGGKLKGRHTTTAARLFHFPEGGDLIDSPGIREFGMAHMTPGDIVAGFVEFAPFLEECRFRDCSHEEEPGCGLRKAVLEGRVDARRVESYRRILQSVAGQ